MSGFGVIWVKIGQNGLKALGKEPFWGFWANFGYPFWGLEVGVSVVFVHKGQKPLALRVASRLRANGLLFASLRSSSGANFGQ